MDNNSVKLILLCRENNIRQIYIDELERLKANYIVVSIFEELNTMVKDGIFNGILVDVSTIMKASKKDRLSFQQLKNLFPVIQLNWDPNEKTIGTLYYGKSSETDDLETFINNEVAKFNPRKLRKESRRRIILNTLITRDVTFKTGIEKTVTMDLSRSGCFIFTVNEWKESDYVYCLFREIKLNKPVKGKIMRVSSWGKSMVVPGIGISFEEVEKDQLGIISDMIDTLSSGKVP